MCCCCPEQLPRSSLRPSAFKHSGHAVPLRLLGAVLLRSYHWAGDVGAQEETAVTVPPRGCCGEGSRAGRVLDGWLGGNKLESACAEPWTRPSHPTHSGPAQSGALCSDRGPHRTADNASCELLLSEPLLRQLHIVPHRRWYHPLLVVQYHNVSFMDYIFINRQINQRCSEILMSD